MHRFAICVLLYGGDEYAWLHSRCLESLMNTLPAEGAEIRLGLNAMTAKPTLDLILRVNDHFGDGNVSVFDGPNIGKYPRMREMLADVDRPYVMWFDDDSFLRPNEIIADLWLDNLASRMSVEPTGMVGAIYRQQLSKRRRAWLQTHPKFRNQPLHPVYEYFITGGWWAAPTKMLRTLEWPQPELYHNGGDRLLGTLATQNGYRLIDFHEGVAINADASGADSQAPRRGLKTKGLGD